MEVVYCSNICTQQYEPKLMITIDSVNKMFSHPPIFVASNGIETFSGQVTPNVRLKKWGENQGWQLGALNGALQALRFAAESLPSVNCPIVFSHEDIQPVNKEKIVSVFNQMDDCDVFCRKYVGSLHHTPDIRYPYYMIECMVFTPKALSRFVDVQPMNQLHDGKGAEEMMGFLLTNMGFRVKCIPIQANTEMIENEMGFLHNHIH